MTPTDDVCMQKDFPIKFQTQGFNERCNTVWDSMTQEPRLGLTGGSVPLPSVMLTFLTCVEGLTPV